MSAGKISQIDKSAEGEVDVIVRWRLDWNDVPKTTETERMSQLWSPEFTVAGQRFSIIIREEKYAMPKKTSLYLARHGNEPSVPALKFKYSVSILHRRTNTMDLSPTVTEYFRAKTISDDPISYGEAIHFIKSVWNTKRKFRIELKIKIVNHCREASLNGLASDLGELYKNGTFTDVVVRTRDRKFKAHKLLLATRSIKFRSMFTPSYIPNETVEIKDLNSDVVAEMLEFIYTDDCPNLKEMAGKLLDAAIMYKIEGLKDRCIGSIIENLNAGNALEALCLGAQLHSGELKDGALAFIADKSQEVMKSHLWDEIFSTHPQLGREIEEALGKRK